MKVSTTTPASATTTRETTMTEFPLLFTFRGLVAGNGFVAAVEACGRALLVRESEEDWWFYGVEPGGIGEGGKTANEAHLAFNSSINGVLADVAEETPSFKDFKATAESFFGEIDRTDEARWAQARAALRSGAPLEEPFVQQLRRETRETPCEVRITRINATAARPRMNAGEPEIALADAA